MKVTLAALFVLAAVACNPAPAAAPSSSLPSAAPDPAAPPLPSVTVAPEPAPSVAPVASAEPTASARPAPPPSAPEPPSCPPLTPAAGYSDCEAVELTGAPPCEAICRRPRRLSAPNRCCEHPVEVVVLSGARALLRVAACDFVPPDCAHVHGHGNMDANVRVLEGSPPEVLVVEGGCEMRAMAHGYVPPGVAAWSGCVHQRYHWDGKRLVER